VASVTQRKVNKINIRTNRGIATAHAGGRTAGAAVPHEHR
jgi:hypothetical protein